MKLRYQITKFHGILGFTVILLTIYRDSATIVDGGWPVLRSIDWQLPDL